MLLPILLVFYLHHEVHWDFEPVYLGLDQLHLFLPVVHHEVFAELADVLAEELVQTDGIVLVGMELYSTHLDKNQGIHVLCLVSPIYSQTWCQVSKLFLGHWQLVWDTVPPLHKGWTDMAEWTRTVSDFQYFFLLDIAILAFPGWSFGLWFLLSLASRQYLVLIVFQLDIFLLFHQLVFLRLLVFTRLFSSKFLHLIKVF